MQERGLEKLAIPQTNLGWISYGRIWVARTTQSGSMPPTCIENYYNQRHFMHQAPCGWFEVANSFQQGKWIQEILIPF